MNRYRGLLVAAGVALGALTVWPVARFVEKRRLTRLTKAELYERAKEADLPGRSTMSKDELADHLRKI
jgi:hypothetical protein